MYTYKLKDKRNKIKTETQILSHTQIWLVKSIQTYLSLKVSVLWNNILASIQINKSSFSAQNNHSNLVGRVVKS